MSNLSTTCSVTHASSPNFWRTASPSPPAFTALLAQYSLWSLCCRLPLSPQSSHSTAMETSTQGQPTMGQPAHSLLYPYKQATEGGRESHSPGNLVTLQHYCHQPPWGHHLPTLLFTLLPFFTITSLLIVLEQPRFLPQVQLMILLHSSSIN